MSTEETVVDRSPEVDGAGIAGLHALHELRGSGLRCRVFDSAGGIGGTGYWNRYPGARVDIESVEYSYSFDEDLQQQWEWTERYAAQPELLRYLNHVADRFDLRPHITLDSRLDSAVFDEAAELWTVTSSQGEVVRAQFCVVAAGFVSAPSKPAFRGGELLGHALSLGSLAARRRGLHRTAGRDHRDWLLRRADDAAQQAAHLTVFQRTPRSSSRCATARCRRSTWRGSRRPTRSGAPPSCSPSAGTSP